MFGLDLIRFAVVRLQLKPQPFGRLEKKVTMDYKVSLSESVVIEENHQVGLTDGKTGRSAIHSDSIQPTDATLIDSATKMFVGGCPDPFLNYLTNLVERFSSTADTQQEFYRAVSASVKVSGNQIGPSPKSNAGRYNEKGERCLYLCDNRQALFKEVGATDLLVQTYRVPIQSIRVANVTADNSAISNNLSFVFQLTERGTTGDGFELERELEQLGKCRYELSQCVARAFRDRGWDGLYVPGVHGVGGETYRNLVLFGNCLDSWQRWTVGNYEAIPRRFSWPKRLAGVALAVYALALILDGLLALFGAGDFTWIYDDYWICGGSISQGLMYAALPSAVIGNIVALVIHPIEGPLRSCLPLLAYLATIWVQWLLLGILGQYLIKVMRNAWSRR